MSKILKLKSLFYKYTGIFLAHKEENEYIDSPEYWKQFAKYLNNSKLEDMSPRNVHGLMVGIWQCEHGFARPVSFLRYKNPKFLFKTLGWFVDLYTVVKWDIQLVYRRMVLAHHSLGKPDANFEADQEFIKAKEKPNKKANKTKKGSK
jgi:hypothetical protein